MLLILPIILSRISHNFSPLFFFYSHAIIYYYSYTILQTLLHQSHVMSTLHMIAKKWVHFTAITFLFFLILFEKQHFAFILIISLLFDMLHYFQPILFPIILLLCLQASYYSSIIPTKFVTYYSQA